MTAPQGLFTYGGVDPGSIVSGSFTLAHGIGPSRCTLYVATMPATAPKVGPLSIGYGSVKLTFRDCVLDSVSREIGEDGRELWGLHLYDRRWKWRAAPGQISGYYNVRRGGKESIVADTKKTPRELAKLCLEAMGESGYDVSELPDGLYPEIEWDYARPAEALASLAESLGCLVVLSIKDRVRVCKVGQGKTLPMGPTWTSGGGELDTPERPDRLVVVSAPTRWQADLDLEAVGLDVSGDVVPIDQLSYKPSAGWGTIDMPNFNGVEPTKTKQFKTCRDLAKETVFRWYRVKTPIKLAGEKEPITEIDRILPIGDRQIVTAKVEGREEPKPAVVYGIFYGGLESRRPYMDDVPPTEAGVKALKNREKSNDSGYYAKSFSIDREKGIVKFGEPVYYHDGLGTIKSTIKPAVLALTVAVMLRDAKTRAWMREEFERSLSGSKKKNAPARYVLKEDLAYHYVDGQDNRTEADKVARYYLDALAREYQVTDPQSISYAGIEPIDLDGAIHPVTWSLAESGFATTRASRNREELLVSPSYEERRLAERTVAMQRVSDWLDSNRKLSAKLDRGRA
jgi:hypothetical protein